MLKKQASNGSSDSDDNSTYDYGSGRRLNNSSNVASTSSEHNQPYKSGIEGPMILKPSNPDYSDILLQEIARISEQQRREAAMAASVESANSQQMPSTSSETSQNTVLTTIANQYNTNSILPLRLIDQQNGDGTSPLRSQNLQETDAISRANLSRVDHQQAIRSLEQINNHDFSYPMMLQRDSHSSCLAQFSIGSHKIVGFVVGGEPRLCIPQLKALVFPEYNGLDKLMSDLRVASINATSDQLSQLIQANALPKTIGYCPLITRSNAERLINYCVIKGIRPLYGIGNTDNFMDAGVRMALHDEGIEISHFCFGGQSAIYYPSLLSGSCIECVNCHRLFQPPEFVRHSHAIDETEAKVCDWGFDSANWKFYINLAETTELTEQNETRLRQLLSFAYDHTSPSRSTFNLGLASTMSETNLASTSGLHNQQQPVPI